LLLSKEGARFVIDPTCEKKWEYIRKQCVEQYKFWKVTCFFAGGTQDIQIVMKDNEK